MNFISPFKIIYYYYYLLFVILCILALICSTYFILSEERFPINELEDFDWFNKMFPDCADGMLYDMSYSQRYQINTLPKQFTELIDSNSMFLDIGSGGGEATVGHLHRFFGNDIKIILSDLHPKVNLWSKLSTENISYIREPVDATHLSNLPDSVKTVTLFGSLHHMDPTTVEKVFEQIRENNMTLFIVEPRRFCSMLQYLHILTLPVFGLIAYSIVSLGGSAIMADNPFYGLMRFLLVPFFMTFDHILGAARRYSVEEIESMSNGLKLYHYWDWTFDYYILAKN
uniref:Methyltransferase domain-containing protein n=1 Tax=viral metagenome TaxID=1070528 RepID=A0A6C0B2J5_9ZZZZ